MSIPVNKTKIPRVMDVQSGGPVPLEPVSAKGMVHLGDVTHAALHVTWLRRQQHWGWRAVACLVAGEDVGALDVAVYHALPVQVRQALQHLRGSMEPAVACDSRTAGSGCMICLLEAGLSACKALTLHGALVALLTYGHHGWKV